MSDYLKDYTAPECTDWTEEEMARHTPAEVFDHAQECARNRAAVETRYHGSIGDFRAKLATTAVSPTPSDAAPPAKPPDEP